MNNQEQFIAMSHQDQIERLEKEVEQLKRQLGMTPGQSLAEPERKFQEESQPEKRKESAQDWKPHRTAQDAGCPEPKAERSIPPFALVDVDALKVMDEVIKTLAELRAKLQV